MALTSKISQPWRVEDRLTVDQVTELLMRYQAGETSRALAESLDIGKTIVRLLRKHGVQVRERGKHPRD